MIRILHGSKEVETLVCRETQSHLHVRDIIKPPPPPGFGYSKQDFETGRYGDLYRDNLDRLEY